MPIRGARGLWLRGLAAVGACLLALASTGAMVTAAVTGPGTSVPAILVSHGNGDSNGKGNDNGNVSTSQDSNGKGEAKKPKPAKPTEVPKPTPKPKPKPTPAPTPRPPVHPRPAPQHSSSVQPVSAAGTTHTPAPTPAVVVDSSDPAPFSAQAVVATDAARVLPVERLGPLSGISFGSGLFIWPVLLAVDVLALAVIARMALRRRFLAED